MSDTKVRVAVVGASGAFGLKHLDGLAQIDDAEVTVVSGTKLESTQEVADKYGVPTAVVGLEPVLERDDVGAVILATPTPVHAEQAQAVLAAGKHVQVEIPLADSLADAEAALAAAEASAKVAMVGHTRRFNPSHQWVHHKITDGEFNVQQMDVQTYFFRRKNINAKGKPRTWTDHLLWHHAAHRRPVRLPGGADRRGERAAGADQPRARHRDRHVHPAQERVGGDLHPVPVVQQRRPAGNVLPLHRRHRHLHRPLRRPRERQGGADRRLARRRQHERHRAAGPRVRRRDPGGREPNSSFRRVIDCYRVLGQLEEQLGR